MKSFFSNMKAIRWRRLARDLLQQTRDHQLPVGAAVLDNTVRGVMSQRRGGLLSIGTVAAVWAASNGLYALMQQLNLTYEVKEGRPFVKVRGLALLLTVLFGVLIVGAFALVVLGGFLQDVIGAHLGSGPVLLAAFAALRWVIIIVALMLALAVVYYLGPDVEQKFRWVSPGAVLAVILLILAAIGIRIYTGHFAHYDKTYGSIGAVIVLMLWFFVVGYVVTLGSEINAAVEHHAPAGKERGRKRYGEDASHTRRDVPARPVAPSHL